MKIMVINGPNLNFLGKRDFSIYGEKTLEEIIAVIKLEGKKSGVDIIDFQSNCEGILIDFIQQHYMEANGIIINPGALTYYGLSLRDALHDTKLPIIEIHLSNIYNREEWRAKSVIAPISMGQIAGFGWRSYVAGLRILVEKLQEK